jgi:hypothetical protein
MLYNKPLLNKFGHALNMLVWANGFAIVIYNQMFDFLEEMVEFLDQQISLYRNHED